MTKVLRDTHLVGEATKVVGGGGIRRSRRWRQSGLVKNAAKSSTNSRGTQGLQRRGVGGTGDRDDDSGDGVQRTAPCCAVVHTRGEFRRVQRKNW